MRSRIGIIGAVMALSLAVLGVPSTGSASVRMPEPGPGPGPAKVKAKSSDGKEHPPIKVKQPAVPGSVDHPLYLEVFAYGVNATPLVTTTGGPSGYFPSVIKNMLGLTGDGTGQTIAIVTAYDHPYIAQDLATFNTQFGLPAPPSFKKLTQTGATTGYPIADPGWALETALDVQWAHAIAPKASIVLIEAKTSAYADMMTALTYAATKVTASVISNSWGSVEFSTQTTYDAKCKLTAKLCVFSTGDTGNPGSYPAYNPYVLAVGGTTLGLSIAVDGSTVVDSETAWAGSGGGVSLYEAKPSYQNAVNATTKRGTSDVSYNADPATGVPVYSSYPYNGQVGWFQMGGTSAGAPQWAGILAVANQQRVALKKTVLAAQPSTGVFKAHTAIYGLTTGMADITSGTNGTCGAVCTAITGYDFVTGKGSPRKGIDAALKATP
jgi:subtilase family serine protease